MKNKLEKYGSFGAIFAAAACPICFPKLAILGAVFGLGALAPFETALFFGAQIFMVLALVGHTLSYKNHKVRKIYYLALLSVIVFFFSIYLYVSEILSYTAFVGLIAATIWLVFENKRTTACLVSPPE